MGERMAGKAVIVTGAGSTGQGWGNGKAAAVLYAREGGKVLAVDRRIAAAEETAAIIAGEGGTAVAFEADVTDPLEVLAMVKRCVDVFDRLDVLHNNVGIAETGGPVEATLDSWDRVIRINQTSVFLTCKHALPVMEEQRAGAIVNVASIAAIRSLGFPYAAYSASKAAVIAMTRNMAIEYAPKGIRANCVLPGLMNTPMIRAPLTASYGGDVDEMIARRDAQCPTGKMGDAWDTAYASLFLASDEARYITGHELVVDGGITQKCV
ncbi:SDR family NAD(P)-dependent oxidoreductase [Acuticoccus mangrovi]|uniref:Glucose 1-dehydrogenase n=1 Tax=Acuticoccus mangrovi TaxID=2796142 RepID=A0A934MFG6_9HYPH|nr:glucose 1-dehydrogenase [Acuticoccus mangrovi]MBJ3778647.1 glucose 1-dehydrogenase [Acuticoccus mangrovi]